MFTRVMREARQPRLSLRKAFALITLLITVGQAAALPAAWAGPATGWPDDGGLPFQFGAFRQFIDSLRALIAQVTEWVQLFRRSATDMLGQMVWELPGQVPDEVDLTALARQIERLPAALRGILDSILKKLRMPPFPGSTGARHHAYIESSPALIHEAADIAQTDELIAVGTVRQAAASQATAAGAAAVSLDLRPEEASAAAWETSDALISAGKNLPSSRAGIELLIAGIGAGLRHQADLGAAAADRLTVLVHQTAQVSQQVEALGATMGAWTLRQAERDRQALEGQLGLADTAAVMAGTLQDVLSGAGAPPADEPRLQPLY